MQKVILLISVVLIRLIFSASLSAETFYLVSDLKDNRVLYGIGHLQQVLKDKNHSLKTKFDPAEAKKGKALCLQICSELPDKARLSKPESFAIISKGNEIKVIGFDARGVLHGLMDLAETVKLYGLSGIPEKRVKEPDYKLRAFMMHFPTHIKTGTYFSPNTKTGRDDVCSNRRRSIYSARAFYDKPFMIELLDYLAECKYNAFFFWHQNPLAALCYIPEYPEALKSVDEEKPMTKDRMINERIPYIQWFISECGTRGIDVYFMSWHIFVPKAVTEKHPEARTAYWSDESADFNRKAVRSFVQTYPEIAGIGGCAGDPGFKVANGKVKEDWMKDVVIDGILESGVKDCTFIYRGHGADPNYFERLQDYYPNFKWTTRKHNEENTISPLPSLALRRHAADVLVNGEPMDCITWDGAWVSNDTGHPYPWFHPEFTRKMLKNDAEAGVDGFGIHLRRGSEYLEEWKQDWLWIKSAGKYSFDYSRLDREYWIRLIKQKYGTTTTAAEKILDAYINSSDFSCLFFSQHYCEATIKQPQLGLTYRMMSTGGPPGRRYNPFPPYLKEGKRTTLKSYLNGGGAEMTPLQVYETVLKEANACFRLVQEAAPYVTQEKESFQRFYNQMHLMQELGKHYAHKGRSILFFGRYFRLGEKAELQKGYEELTKSFDAFSNVREFGKKLYPDAARDLNFFRWAQYRDYSYDDQWPELTAEVKNPASCFYPVVADIEGRSSIFFHFFKAIGNALYDGSKQAVILKPSKELNFNGKKLLYGEEEYHSALPIELRGAKKLKANHTYPTVIYREKSKVVVEVKSHIDK